MKPILICFLVATFYLNPMDEPSTVNSVTKSYPVENHPRVKTIKLSTGVKLEYVEQGDINGVPVVFLHGYSDSWHSFETVLKYMPANLHSIAISQRGHGNSQKPDIGYLMDDFARDLADFIRKLKLGQVVLVGHSMGGLITQQFAVNFPDLVKGVVIVSSDACFGNNPGMPEFEKQINALTDPIDFEFANEFQRSTCAIPIDSGYYQTLVQESLKLPANVWKKVMGGIMTVDLSRSIAAIDKPTLVIWGRKDSYCSKEDQEVILSGIKHAQFLIYEDAGHALHWEQPARFTKDLTQFINSSSRN